MSNERLESRDQTPCFNGGYNSLARLVFAPLCALDPIGGREEVTP